MIPDEDFMVEYGENSNSAWHDIHYDGRPIGRLKLQDGIVKLRYPGYNGPVIWEFKYKQKRRFNPEFEGEHFCDDAVELIKKRLQKDGLVYAYFDFEKMIGKTIVKITESTSCITLTDSDNKSYEMRHIQSGKERVFVDGFQGNVSDIINHPIKVALVSSQKVKIDSKKEEVWTYFILATKKGHFIIRWCGATGSSWPDSGEVSYIKLKK